jgi:predicted DNA-binding transcriptional regulator YafY
MAQAERLYWMDGMMQGGAYLHWQAVVDKFEVQRRTVFDDAKFLRERLGAPIAFSRRYKGWHYTAPNYQLPFLALTATEADTLRRTLVASLAYLPSADAAAARQLAIRLSPYVHGLPIHGGNLPSTSEIFLSGQPVLASHLAATDDLLGDIRRAVDDRHRLQITYYSAHRDEVTERVVHPYFLLNHGGEIYLIGYCEMREDSRDFGLHRIRESTVLEPPHAFKVPETFDAAAY